MDKKSAQRFVLSSGKHFCQERFMHCDSDRQQGMDEASFEQIHKKYGWTIEGKQKDEDGCITLTEEDSDVPSCRDCCCK
eukprot:4457783-Amphidinium_carterae.3